MQTAEIIGIVMASVVGGGMIITFLVYFILYTRFLGILDTYVNRRSHSPASFGVKDETTVPTAAYPQNGAMANRVPNGLGNDILLHLLR